MARSLGLGVACLGSLARDTHCMVARARRCRQHMILLGCIPSGHAGPVCCRDPSAHRRDLGKDRLDFGVRANVAARLHSRSADIDAASCQSLFILWPSPDEVLMDAHLAAVASTSLIRHVETKILAKRPAYYTIAIGMWNASLAMLRKQRRGARQCCRCSEEGCLCLAAQRKARSGSKLVIRDAVGRRREAGPWIVSPSTNGVSQFSPLYDLKFQRPRSEAKRQLLLLAIFERRMTKTIIARYNTDDGCKNR